VKLKVKFINCRNKGHAFVAVAGVFSCEFLIAEVALFLHAPVTKHRTSKNGTTSTKEMSTAKYSNATLHKSMPLISGICYI